MSGTSQVQALQVKISSYSKQHYYHCSLLHVLCSHNIYHHAYHFSIFPETSCRTKVNQLDVTRSRNEYILWLHVSVYEPQLMEIMESGSNL